MEEEGKAGWGSQIDVAPRVEDTCASAASERASSAASHPDYQLELVAA